MPFDPIWLLVPITVLFSGWLVYEHRRIDARAPEAEPHAHELHEWAVSSEENTNGKPWRVYVCTYCQSRERRQVG